MLERLGRDLREFVRRFATLPFASPDRVSGATSERPDQARCFSNSCSCIRTTRDRRDRLARIIAALEGPRRPSRALDSTVCWPCTGPPPTLNERIDLFGVSIAGTCRRAVRRLGDAYLYEPASGCRSAQRSMFVGASPGHRAAVRQRAIQSDDRHRVARRERAPACGGTGSSRRRRPGCAVSPS
jgi:hypothetical protein